MNLARRVHRLAPAVTAAALLLAAASAQEASAQTAPAQTAPAPAASAQARSVPQPIPYASSSTGASPQARLQLRSTRRRNFGANHGPATTGRVAHVNAPTD